MSAVDWIYGVGISVALTLTLMMAVKAVYRSVSPPDARRVATEAVRALLDERDRLLLNIRDLDFDHAVRKVSDEDRLALVAQLREELVRVLARLEELGVDPETRGGSEHDEDEAA